MIGLIAFALFALVVKAEAVEFRAATHAGSSPATSCSAAVPTGVQNGDLLLAMAIANQTSSGETITAPTGWTEVATHYNTTDTVFRVSLFRKIASSESGSYNFTSSENVRFSCTVTAWYDGINPTNPIAQYTNTAYTVNNATLRAAGLTTTAPASLLIVGIVACNPACPISPPTSPSAFTEQVDHFENRHQRYFASLNWTGSGSTGDVDATLSGSNMGKHAFLVELASAGGSAAPLTLRRRF